MGLSNIQIADLLNSEYGTNYDESKFRKEYQAYINVWKDMIEEKHKASLPNGIVEELRYERNELKKKKFALVIKNVNSITFLEKWHV